MAIPWQEPLFRNASLPRQLPFEARLALAEHLVTHSAALWADEVEAKEAPKKDWELLGTAGYDRYIYTYIYTYIYIKCN